MQELGCNSGAPWRWLGTCSLLGLLLVGLSLPGCGGCRQAKAPLKKDDQAKPKPKPKPKPDFERLEVSGEPFESLKSPLKAVKPGHWLTALVETKANNFDFSGELDMAATDAQGQLINLERTPYRLTTTRPAALAKGQTKRLEATLFIPRGRERTGISSQLRDRRTGREVRRENELLSHMPAYQYFLLGLVRQPDSYRYLKVLNSIRPPLDDPSESTHDGAHYRVLLPQIGQSVSLPSDPLCWTSLAYIVWDDIEPDTLGLDQRQALIDWLHWGGQVIISGPKTLDLLQHSFLEPYLPATASKPDTIDDERLDDLNGYWTIEPPVGPARHLAATKPWSGVKLAKQGAAEFVPNTGELVCERGVGRGRIVATAFRLTERDLLNWPSFDSFFNACLLRRPERRYTHTESLDTRLDWAQLPGQRHDPALISRLRYFSRDAAAPGQSRALGPDNVPVVEEEVLDPFGFDAGVLPAELVARQREERNLRSAQSDSGVGGWNDFGPVASAARQALKQAAGITIPKRQFVLKVLLVYLTVLVPLNWLVFWLIGRVEWAWIAAPLIAVVCALSVVWLAQLDIGFARSTTEVAVVELQGGYPRAHVTRYTALYTSLSTTYDVQLEQPSALALPFSTDPQFQLLTGQQRTTVTLHRDASGKTARLTGFAVSSNSTGMIHSEHMADLEGSLALEATETDALRVTNTTRLALSGAGVLRIRPDGEAELAWVGTLGPGDRANLSFTPADEARFSSERQADGQGRHDPSPDTLSLAALIDLAENVKYLLPGDVRLVAWMNSSLPGLTIEPSASQQRAASLVVANLRFGAGEPPRPDINLPKAIKPLDDMEPEMVDETKPLPDGPIE